LLEFRRSKELAEASRELAAQLGNPLLNARLYQALGRSAQRFNHDREAAELFRESARIAETVGDAAYEVAVTANMHLGFALPFLGLLDEAEERLARAQAMCEEKGDELHLAGVLNNRSCLWIARNDRERFLEDNQRVAAYARRMGNSNLERHCNLNSAYFFYWRGEFGLAEPGARRMIEIDERCYREGGFQPDGAVLLARILWGGGNGDEAAARKLVEHARAHQAAARAQGKNELLLLPNDEMLLDTIALVIERGDSAAWEELLVRAREVAQGQELIETLELAGLAALRRQDLPAAQRHFREALEAGKRIPNVLEDRIRGRLAQIA
jgi:hypothetical protein